MPNDTAGDKLPTAGVTPSGSAFRATATVEGDTWLCAHVHFTQQSARTCADQHVREIAKASPAL